MADAVTKLITKNGPVLIDSEDAQRVLRYNTWCISKRGDVVSYSEYGPRHNRVRKVHKLHRVIMDAPAGMVVDHINHDPTDNRKANLRICMQAENSRNLRRKCNNTSGIPGVRWDSPRCKWVARIKVNYRNVFLGRFDTKSETVDARQKAERQYFGEFASRSIA